MPNIEPVMDITCTATLRPELLKRTVFSHIKNLFGDFASKCRFIINIDPTGFKNEADKAECISEIYRLIDTFPFPWIDLNMSNVCSFPLAFNWCIEQVQTPLFFHLEEDWEMVKEIHFDSMVKEFENNPKLNHLRLSAFRSEIARLKTWNRFMMWNGRYFEVPLELNGSLGWAGHPSLNRTSFMKECFKYMDIYKNPEKQIKHHNPRIKPILEKGEFGVFHYQDMGPSIKDIGREWMVKNGWKKEGNKAHFTRWTRDN